MPATPNGDVRLGAPGVVPVIAVAQAGSLGTGLAELNGAGCAARGAAGVVGCGRTTVVLVVDSVTVVDAASRSASAASVSVVEVATRCVAFGVGPSTESVVCCGTSGADVDEASCARALVTAPGSTPPLAANAPVDRVAATSSAAASVVRVVVVRSIVRPPGLIAPPGAPY